MKSWTDIKKPLSIIFIKLRTFFIWVFFGVLTGVACGILGGLFSRCISLATFARFANGKLTLLLPLFGVISVAVYKLCRVTGVGTNNILIGAQSENKIPFRLIPAIFIGSVLTHLGGGSAGKEGAALQLGGATAEAIAKIFRFSSDKRRVIITCGMAGLFSAVFGTPVGAAVFALEVVCVGEICSAAILPAFITSVTAKTVDSICFPTVHDKFLLKTVPSFEPTLFLKIAAVAIVGAAISFVFCHSLNLSEKLFKRFFKNEYLRISVGAALIIALCFIFKTEDYNGSSSHILENIFKTNTSRPESFLLKIIFTAITVGAGFKGGEIVPTMFIGAAFGCSFGSLLGLPGDFAAAIGLVSLFCGVTNCPLATIFLAAELFGGEGLLSFAVCSGLSFALSGNIGLYSAQKLGFKKLFGKDAEI